LIADDHAGLPLAPRVRSYERLYQSFYDSMLQIFRDQYPLFGDVTVMAAKIIWDHAFYWGVLCQLVFQQRLADVALFADLAPELALAQELNQGMQARFRQWHETTTPQNPPVIFDQRQLPWFVALNEGMHDTLDDAGVRERLRENVRLLQGLADAIAARATVSGAEAQGTPSGQPQPLLFTAPA
jgi:hypothetical protein